MFTGPKIVKEGLVLHLDAANPKSYPGTGNAWKDLSKKRNEGILVGEPAYSPTNNGCMTIDAINDEIILDSSLGDISTEKGTISIFTRIDSVVSSAALLSIRYNSSNNIELVAVPNSIDIKYKGGNVEKSYSTPVLMNSTSPWYFFTLTYDKGLDESRHYVNKTLIGTHNNLTQFTTPPSVFRLGTNGEDYYRIECKVSTLSVYDRPLTSEEIQHNYNSIRSRFNL